MLHHATSYLEPVHGAASGAEPRNLKQLRYAHDYLQWINAVLELSCDHVRMGHITGEADYPADYTPQFQRLTHEGDDYDFDEQDRQYALAVARDIGRYARAQGIDEADFFWELKSGLSTSLEPLLAAYKKIEADYNQRFDRFKQLQTLEKRENIPLILNLEAEDKTLGANVAGRIAPKGADMMLYLDTGRNALTRLDALMDYVDFSIANFPPTGPYAPTPELPEIFANLLHLNANNAPEHRTEEFLDVRAILMNAAEFARQYGAQPDAVVVDYVRLSAGIEVEALSLPYIQSPHSMN